MVLILHSEYLTLDPIAIYLPTKIIQIIYTMMGTGILIK
jgi:hypothetical protein